MPKPHIPLEQIRAEVEACRKCPLADGRTQTVFGVGNPAARVLSWGRLRARTRTCRENRSWVPRGSS